MLGLISEMFGGNQKLDWQVSADIGLNWFLPVSANVMFNKQSSAVYHPKIPAFWFLPLLTGSNLKSDRNRFLPEESQP